MSTSVDLRLAIGVALYLAGATGQARSLTPAQSHDELAQSFARTVAVQALTFEQGDRQALDRVRSQFTDEGWQEFLKSLAGWLDPEGTPTFGSGFVPSGSGRIVDERNEVVHVRIPGSLTQTQHQARTTYRAFAADVWVGGNPLKVHRLTQTTCKSGSTACQ
jgi:hypothetical protein